MPGAPIYFLEQAQQLHPSIAADLAEFAELYDKKLWHELTVKLTDALGKPEFHKDDFLVQLYRRAATPVKAPHHLRYGAPLHSCLWRAPYESD
jgi:hypothetical protein